MQAASRISAVGGRLQKSAPSSLIVPLALLIMVYHHCLNPMHLLNNLFSFLYYYVTLFCQRRATHTTSRISAISGRMQQSAPNSLIVRLALLTMVYWHDSVPGVSTKQTFVTSIFYYTTLFCQRRAAHTTSRISAIS